MKGYIYTLSELGSEDIRYIGQTVEPYIRVKKHRRDSKYANNYCRCWVNSILKKNSDIQLEIIELCDKSEMDFWERHYISIYRSWGFRLTNLTNGGFTNKFISIETRNKISNSLKGKIQSDETKLKRRITSIETWKNEQLRALKREQTINLHRNGFLSRKGIASKKKGIKLSSEIIEKISLAHKKRYAEGAIPYNKNLKKVCQIDLHNNILNIFDTPTDAANSINGLTKRIISVCEHKIKTHKNFRWEYYENRY